MEIWWETGGNLSVHGGLQATKADLRLAHMTNNMPDTPTIALVAYEGAQQSALHGLGEMFDVANRLADASPARQISHRLLDPASLDETQRFDAVILPPNLTGVRGEEDGPLHAWLRRQHHRGTIMCSACAGGYWLGYAGILDGRPATTHWALEADFRATFPKVTLTPERILVDDNDVVTAGGVMAWVDLGLHLVGRWLGPATVSRICRQMLIDPAGREQQTYRRFSPNMSHTDQSIRSLQLWMESHTGEDLSVRALAQRAGMSERSLHRRFAKATGLTINSYVQELRVERAKGLLELTSLPVTTICWQVGYHDVPAFARLFKAATGVSPGAYRHRFQIAA